MSEKETQGGGGQAENPQSKVNQRVLSSLLSRNIYLCSNMEGNSEGGVVCRILFASFRMLFPGHGEMVS
jgi:hypothetical protein